MDVGAAFVADGEAPEAPEPGEAALHHPAVPTKTLAVLDTLAGDAGRDAALAASLSAWLVVIGFVGVQLLWSSTWPATAAAAEAGHGIERWRQHLAVMPVGGAQDEAERRALGIGDAMALGA